MSKHSKYFDPISKEKTIVPSKFNHGSQKFIEKKSEIVAHLLSEILLMLDARAVCYSKTIFSSDEIANVIHRLFKFLEDPICGMRACLGFKHSTVEDYYIPLHHSLLHLVVLVKAARRKYGDNFCLSDVSNEGPERTNKLMQDFFQTHSNHHFNPYEADEGHGYRA